jgi:hypothetical protein
VLVFGTTFATATGEGALVGQWQSLHRAVNGWSVDLLLVDSASPVLDGWLADGPS